MLAICLQSGSNGNCVYVESDGVGLLLDAGISGVQAERRLAQFGRDIRQVRAVIISHDHKDHIRCAGVYQRKFGLPVYVTAKTLAAACRWQSLGALAEVRHFTAGQCLTLGRMTVETIPTPHDGADGVVFVVACRGKRLGVFTDLGHVFADLRKAVRSVDAALLESNYDPEMLERGPYPAFLKGRIKGPGGHVSNEESAELLLSAGGRLKWACLAHLSEQNNEPELALATHRRVHGARVPLLAASRYQATGPLEIP